MKDSRFRFGFWSRTRSKESTGRSSADRRRRPAAAFRALVIEPLETRTLLSVDLQLPVDWQAVPTARVHLLSGFNASGSSNPSGLTPNQVRGAYGLGTYSSGVQSGGISFNGILGDGTGQTIAIVDAYDNPNVLSDLNAFSTYYGLPTFGVNGGPTFTKLNQTGGTTLPSTDPQGPWSTNGGLSTWAMEEALDVQWAHAMAPQANIILFEASNTSSGLYTAVQTAATTPGVVAVSMSWGGNEFSAETTYDSSYFVTPAGHLGGSATMGGTKIAGGVTFFASSGDYGAYTANGTTITPQYPAASPNVVSVGGTSLYVSGNTYSSETTWGNGTSSGTSGGGGGGISTYESQPSYQSSVVGA